MISKEQYEEALVVVELYKEQEKQRVINMLPSVELKLKEFFKNTYVKEFYLSIDHYNNDIDITSEDPMFDEDYDGHFDKDMKRLSEEFGVRILFESGNYSK